MTTIVISDEVKKDLQAFFQGRPRAELIPTFLFYVEKQHHIDPVAFPPGKTIFQSKDIALKTLEKQEKVWRQTEIKVRYGQKSVNEETARIYICPFTGKVFGDNTHPNPQDAIYDWVMSCEENTERVDGMRVKRFFVSEDPKVIKSYITGGEKTITKTVYSSPLTNKLYNDKESVIEEFKETYLRPMTLVEVQNQNRFTIEEGFLHFLQDQMSEKKITAFVEALAEYEEFLPHVQRWVEDGEEDED